MKKTVLYLLFCVTLLTACAEPLVSVRTERITIPEALLTCPVEPKPGEISTQRDVALYLIDLREYGRACEAKLKSVKQLQDDYAIK